MRVKVAKIVFTNEYDLEERLNKLLEEKSIVTIYDSPFDEGKKYKLKDFRITILDNDSIYSEALVILKYEELGDEHDSQN